MENMDQLYRAKGLLTQALSAALHSMPNNRSVQDARLHMKKALTELDHAANSQTHKKRMNEDQFKTWWSNVVSGTANQAQAPTSSEAQQKSLNQLNSMIEEEKKKLDELEKQSIQPDAKTQVFND